MDALLSTNPSILASIISYLDAPRALAALAATNHALRHAAIDDALWRPHFLAAFPASAALLPLLHARGLSIHAYYALRMREQQTRRVPSERPTPEEKEARLRAFFADTYLELQVTDNRTGEQLASRLISLAEEAEVVLAFFRGERVPLTMVQVEEAPWYYYDDEVNYSRSATLLRMGDAKSEMLMLATAVNKIEDVEGTNYETSIYYETSESPYIPEYCKCFKRPADSPAYYIPMSVYETKDCKTDIWKMAMSCNVVMLFLDDGEIEFAFESVCDVLGFLEFLLKGKAVWRQPAGIKREFSADDDDDDEQQEEQQQKQEPPAAAAPPPSSPQPPTPTALPLRTCSSSPASPSPSSTSSPCPRSPPSPPPAQRSATRSPPPCTGRAGCATTSPPLPRSSLPSLRAAARPRASSASA